MNSAPRIRFLGAAGTVTGSKYLLTYQDRQILIDCGLFQGLKELRLKNWDRFPIDPKTIDAIVLTHAHIDHSGYIPRLVKEGFKGKVYCTPATFALARILLPDTGYLQEEEAEYLNRRKISKHHPALPLFDKEEAENSLKYFEAKEFDQEFEVSPGIRVRLIYAGHILGAAQAIISVGGKTIGFSGDLGRQVDPIFYPPASPPPVDYLVVESTYGNRRHEPANPLEALRAVVCEAYEKRSVVLVPSFTVGRAQTLMYLLSQLRKANQIPAMPIYLNSPMATNVTKVFCEFQPLHKLSEAECDETCAVAKYIGSAEESMALNRKHGPMLILSASGMATGGRILHHLKAFAPDPNNYIVLAGFQAKGTRGRQILEGAQEIKIHGELVSVRAQVRDLSNLSAHADYEEILAWLNKAKLKPKKIFITHGEPEAAASLKEKIDLALGLATLVPGQDQEFSLE